MLYNEEWRPIMGYEGQFIVSDKGRIRSLDRIVSKGFCGKIMIKGRDLSIQKNCRNGYMQIHLRNKVFYVHRLVAKAFPEICGEWFDGCVVDHINTIRDDNRAENLSSSKGLGCVQRLRS